MPPPPTCLGLRLSPPPIPCPDASPPPCPILLASTLAARCSPPAPLVMPPSPTTVIHAPSKHALTIPGSTILPSAPVCGSRCPLPLRCPCGTTSHRSGIHDPPPPPPPSAPPATAGDLGPLEILVVESYTNHALFANQLAYEQSRDQWKLQRLVSYVLLMVSVVDGRRDMEVPQWAGVFMRGDDGVLRAPGRGDNNVL
jgi:hypothetical protein